ncbi:hypothetical protein CLM83_27650 [Streptomyces albidoflavus]|nr:hypothetical protein CLM83_27650 [Streptomyces albidoflavus]
MSRRTGSIGRGTHVVLLLMPGVQLPDLAAPPQVFRTVTYFVQPYPHSYLNERQKARRAPGLRQSCAGD